MKTDLFFYPEHIRWHSSLAKKKAAFDVFSSSQRKKIRRALNALQQQSEYSFLIEKVDAAYIDTFLPIYHTFIESKKNGVLFDIALRLQSAMQAGISYESISLYQDQKLIGAFFYSLQEKHFSTAYKVFPRYCMVQNIRMQPTLLAEYFLYERALQEKKEYITHGRDINQFGKNYAIGLAIFKLQLGCIPKPSTREGIVWKSDIEYDDSSDQLVFVGDPKKESIDEMVLFSPKKIEDLQKEYPELFQSSVPITHFF